MKNPHSYLATAFILGSAFFPPYIALAEESSVPCKVIHGSAPATSSLHNFSFGSWPEVSGDNFAIIYCIQNEGSKELFFEWKDTGLLGYVGAESIMTSKTEGTGAARFVQGTKDLEYGSRPLLLSAMTVVPDFAVAVAPLSSDPVTTTTHISVPLGQLSIVGYGTKDAREVRGFIEVKVTFSSQYDQASKSFRHSCNYEVLGTGGYGGITYSLVFDNNDLNVNMFGSTAPIEVRDSSLPFADIEVRGVQVSSERNFEINDLGFEFSALEAATSDSAAIKRTTLDLIYQGKIIASVPIHYLEGG